MAGLYIHIPFCHSKCAYCSFYSGPLKTDETKYVEQLIRELHARKGEITERPETIYIGGGTPSSLSIMPLRILTSGIAEAIFPGHQAFNRDCPAQVFARAGIKEFTLEANPEDVSFNACHEWRKLGVNRLSMGVQSLCDDELKIIRRRHTASQAVDAFHIARRSGFDNISLDLIYGLPGQTAESWEYSVKELLKLRPEHFSAYCLSVERGSLFYAMKQNGKIGLPDEDFCLDCYKTLCQMAKEAGYQHYEISNFALPGRESKHNSSYWQSVPYLGLGPSAYSYDGKHTRRFNPSDIKKYMEDVPCFETETETDPELCDDYIFTSLRTSGGLSVKHLDNLMHGAGDMWTKFARPFIDTGKIVTQTDSAGNIVKARIPEEEWFISDYIIRETMIDG